ncbi:hypothetical protein GCM10027578_41830 [Spirosoma luteolum]
MINRFRILTLILGVLLASASFAQQTASSTDPTQDPTALGNAFFKAMLDEDGTIGKLLTADFNLTSFDGQSVGGDLLGQGLGGGYVIIETATVSAVQTRQYNSDAAVMTGNWKAKGSVQGQTFDQTIAFTVTSVKQGSSWKVASVQFTPMR